MTPVFTLTAEQLYALVSAAQDGVLPQRTARQERNRRYYLACQQRRQAQTSALSLISTPSQVSSSAFTSPVEAKLGSSRPAVNAEDRAADSDAGPCVSDSIQTFSDASETVLDGAQTVVPAAGPSPSLPPSPPSPRPPSSAPTPTPPSAFAGSYVGRRAALASASAPRRRRPRAPRSEAVVSCLSHDDAAEISAVSAASSTGLANAATTASGLPGLGGMANGEAKIAERTGAGVETRPVADRAGRLGEEAWLCKLEGTKAFRSIPVREELERMRAWFAARGLRSTRGHFVNWLRRYEPPLEGGEGAAAQGPKGVMKGLFVPRSGRAAMVSEPTGEVLSPLRRGAGAAASFFAGTVMAGQAKATDL